MFHVTLLVVGKIKEDYFAEAINEYLKRLKPYAKLDVVELKAESFSESTKEKAKKTEAERISSFLDKKPDAQVFILDENGKNPTSREFAQMMEKSESGHFIFVIGGSLGFAPELAEKPYLKLSLSHMTFPHEVARVVLFEQIYRAMTIIKGKEYHY